MYENIRTQNENIISTTYGKTCVSRKINEYKRTGGIVPFSAVELGYKFLACGWDKFIAADRQ